MKSSSVDQADSVPSSAPYYLVPKRSNNTQVDKMKNLFETKFAQEMYHVPINYNQSTSMPKKSSTQPNLMNYNPDESLDKKKVFHLILLHLFPFCL